VTADWSTAKRHGQLGHLAARGKRSKHRRVEPWEPADDVTLIIRTLFNMNAKLDAIGDHVVAIRNLLEDDEEEEEEEI
jgi:hypothetical protein